MGFPTFWNPVTVQVTPLNETTTIRSGLLQEAIHDKKYDPALTLNAQIRYHSKEELAAMGGGDEERTDGYLIFRMDELQTANTNLSPAGQYSPKKGDRVVNIGGMNVSYSIHEARPAEPLRGSFIYMHCEYKDDSLMRAGRSIN